MSSQDEVNNMIARANFAVKRRELEERLRALRWSIGLVRKFNSYSPSLVSSGEIYAALVAAEELIGAAILRLAIEADDD